MVNLTIDDKQVTVPRDATIYDAAKAAGIRIPILCHDKKLHPFGGCRMCLVEVEQMKGRQIPACTTPVTEGMIVRTIDRRDHQGPQAGAGTSSAQTSDRLPGLRRGR